MEYINVSVRMEKGLKEEFERVCNDLGIGMAAALNIYAKRVVKDGGIPFDLNRDSQALVKRVASYVKQVNQINEAGEERETDKKENA